IPATGIIVNNNCNVTIGGGSGWEFFDGLVDNVRVYEQALSETKIQQLYAEGLEKYNLANK
ncbi:LamG domain-containing protein, partial [Patescibacteria group bacterium]|nr:LamG domain-containing protein [Patescibacteria group bacterium]